MGADKAIRHSEGADPYRSRFRWVYSDGGETDDCILVLDLETQRLVVWPPWRSRNTHLVCERSMRPTAAVRARCVLHLDPVRRTAERDRACHASRRDPRRVRTQAANRSNGAAAVITTKGRYSATRLIPPCNGSFMKSVKNA
jgi:hypothetical protein